MLKILNYCSPVLLASHRSFISISSISTVRLKHFAISKPQYYPQNCFTKFQVRQYNTDPDYGKFSSPEKIDQFYEWLTDTTWIQTFENALVSMHDFTGMPWWATIILSTVLLRSMIMTPMYIKQVKYNIKYHMFLPEFSKVYNKLAKEVDEEAKIRNWNDTMAKQQFVSNLYRHRKAMYKKYNVPGLGKRYFLPMIQIPIWLSMSMSLRHISDSLPLNTIMTPEQQSVLLQLSQEGCLWFSNLCLADAFFIMPVLLGVINLSIIEIYRGDGKAKLQGFVKLWIYTVRTFSVILVLVACQMPTAVVLYWFSSSMYGASQALVFRSQRIKKIFRIPVASNESKTPYRDLISRLPFSKKFMK